MNRLRRPVTAPAPGRLDDVAPRQARRWAWAGGLVGVLLGLLAFAPASWMVSAVATASNGRLLLAQGRGTLWSGSAIPVLTAGVGARDASALPGRLHWAWGWDDGTPALRLRQDCCPDAGQTLRLRPGWARLRVEWPASAGAFGPWPAAWLAGLGTPWNTLQPRGTLRLRSEGFSVETVQGRWRTEGRLQLDLDRMASRLSTLPVLGSYRIVVDGGDADTAARLTLSTLEGALRLQGSGQWSGSGLRFRGDARAEAGTERALDNLLNIIGRRQGALSLIAIG